VQGVMVSVSVLTLTVSSVERYYAICHPLHFKTKSRRARMMIVVVWIISLVIILPEGVVLTTFRRFPDDFPTDLLTTCKPAWEYHHQVRHATALPYRVLAAYTRASDVSAAIWDLLHRRL